jgi:two-component system, OmpR family, sensor histidine kinase KdpD
MPNPTRPDPDRLLAVVQQQEAQQRRGKLKIFLGYVAGVGKTYAMLDAARQRQADGVDVAIAYVETHGRAETDLLLHGLEVLPRRFIDYHGVTLNELDLDAVLARRPQLALVDELAHSNAPDARHPKRYQDVEELLDAGIDVYTTLNIQHLASLNDIVAQITGTQVRETIPDRILDTAGDIELIDLPIPELLRRLEEGKVYIPSQARQALQKFFRPGNLNALRELALRRTADRVDEQMRAYMQTNAIAGPWPTTDRLLVSVSASPLGARLVRAGRRLAQRLGAEWDAVYVATPAQANLSARAQEQVAATLRLAEELGARVATLSANTVVDGLVQYARHHNITKIVAGKPLHPRWRGWWRGSVVDQIIRRGPEIDLYVISSAVDNSQPLSPVTVPKATPVPAHAYLSSSILVLLVTALGLPIRPFINPVNLLMFYLLAIVVTALRWGRGPAIAAALLSVLAFDVIFIPPYYTIAVADVEYLLTFVAFFVVGVVISTLATRAANQTIAAREREEQAIAGFEFSRDLSISLSIDEIARATLDHVQRAFGGAVAIYLPDNEQIKLHFATPDYCDDSNNQAVAVWALRHRQAAGADTDTLPASRVLCLPMRTVHASVGVLALTVQEKGLQLPQRRLLETFANQAALALERAELAEEAHRLQLVQEREKFQSTLLNSISHDLRTPLVAITGALSALQESDDNLTPEIRRSLAATAHEQAVRLNRLVGHLLDMSRLESGSVRVRRELSDIQELIGAAIERSTPLMGAHPLEIHIAADLPLVPLDFVLMIQVLTNLLDNAAKYSAADAPITLHAQQVGTTLEITIADRGIGIPDTERERIFDKFHRAEYADSVTGTGLGLSISKGLTEAHGGQIVAAARPGGGSIFTVTLPILPPGAGGVAP